MLRRSLLAMLASGFYRPGAAQEPVRRRESLEVADSDQILKITGTLQHVQGIEINRNIIWVTSVDRSTKRGLLHEVDLVSGKEKRAVEIQQGDQFHPGGMSGDTDSLWIPVAEYRRQSSATIQQRDKSTLQVRFQFHVPDHIGCVAADEERIYGGNWDSRLIYCWERNGRLVSKQEAMTGNSYQDMKRVGRWLVASGLTPNGGAIDWLDPDTFQVRRRVHLGKTDRGVVLTHEGMAIREGKLYLLPEDGPNSRLFVFQLPRFQRRESRLIPPDC
jgi:hypothetical protein